MAFPASLADRIIDAILAGRLPPGTRLDEALLAAQSDVTPAMVRDALVAVCARGLARRLPDGGVEVVSPDLAILLDWFEALGEVQAMCATLAARRAALSDLLPLEDLVARMEDADIHTYRRLAGRFHDRICRLSKNAELSRMAADLRARLAAALQDFTPALAARRHWWLDEHRALLDAIADRNEALAATIMRGHLRAASREVLFTAPGQPASGGPFDPVS